MKLAVLALCLISLFVPNGARTPIDVGYDCVKNMMWLAWKDNKWLKPCVDCCNKSEDLKEDQRIECERACDNFSDDMTSQCAVSRLSGSEKTCGECVGPPGDEPLKESDESICQSYVVQATLDKAKAETNCDSRCSAIKNLPHSDSLLKNCLSQCGSD